MQHLLAYGTFHPSVIFEEYIAEARLPEGFDIVWVEPQGSFLVVLAERWDEGVLMERRRLFFTSKFRYLGYLTHEEDL